MKIKTTQPYKDSSGKDHTVCKGKLELVYNDKFLPEIGMIGSNNVHPLFMWTQDHVNGFESLPEYRNTKMVQPRIISETETINEDDNWLFGGIIINGGRISIPNNEVTFMNPLDNKLQTIAGIDRFQKILAMPEDLSPETLQEIVGGKLKDGDNVFIECGKKFLFTMDEIFNEKKPIWEINLTNNYVTLFPVENNWDELKKQFEEELPPFYDKYDDVFDWLKKNYHTPEKLSK